MGEGGDWSPRSSRKYACTEVYTKKAGRRCYTYHLHFECWNHLIEILLARIHTYVLHTANNKDMCNTYCPLKECIVCRPVDIIHGAAGARREDGGERTGSAERTRTMLWRRRRRRRKSAHSRDESAPPPPSVDVLMWEPDHMVLAGFSSNRTLCSWTSKTPSGFTVLYVYCTHGRVRSCKYMYKYVYVHTYIYYIMVQRWMCVEYFTHHIVSTLRLKLDFYRY